MKNENDSAPPGQVFKFDPAAFSKSMPLSRADRRAWAKKAKKAMKAPPGKSLEIQQLIKQGVVVKGA